MTKERELGWDDEIEKDGGEFTILPAGDYNFTVAKFERGRFNGSDKLPACNEAKLELKIDGGEHGEVTVFHRLFLHTTTEGFLSNFFTGIGQKVKGEKLRMNWNAVVGASGKCKVGINNYKAKNGEDRTNNQVETFYEPTAAPQQPTYQQPAPTYQPPAQPPVQTQAPQYTAPPAQPAAPTYQQPAAPTQQAPFPTQPTNAPPVVPGQF